MRVLKACMSFLILFFLLFGCGESKTQEKTKHAEHKNDTTLDLCIIRADTLNPLRTTVRHNAEVLSLLYDSLFVLSDKNEAIPNLCTKLSVSEDGLKVHLEIRGNVYFQDGATLKAQDVAETVNFILNSSGFYKERLASIDGAEVRGNRVELTLNRTTEHIARLLDFPILPARFLKSFEEGAVLQPPIVGSGLYLPKEFRMNRMIKLRVNKKHHSGNMPAYENINIHILPDVKTAIYMLENKEIDAISERAFDEDIYTPPHFIKTASYPTDRFVFLGTKERVGKDFINRITSSLFLWVEEENIGDIFGETDVLEKNEAITSPERNTLLYCTDRLIQTRTAQKVLQKSDEDGTLMQERGVAKKEYLYYIQNGRYDLFLGEADFLPNRDENDFLLFQEKNSPAKITGLFFVKELLYFQEEVKVGAIKTKNPYLSFISTV